MRFGLSAAEDEHLVSRLLLAYTVGNALECDFVAVASPRMRKDGVRGNRVIEGLKAEFALVVEL